MNAQLQPAEAMAPVDRAAHWLVECKRIEDNARDNRLVAEESLLNLVGVKPEGSTTIKTDLFKITTTGRMTRSLDEAALLSIYSSLPEAIRERVFPTRFGLVLAELRFVERNDPELYRRMAPALTVKPAKSSVAVDRLA